MSVENTGKAATADRCTASHQSALRRGSGGSDAVAQIIERHYLRAFQCHHTY
ncbi:MAG: hypothetical protein RML35_02190 [Chloroherpetonaceae bacterium]|nr:hypothetical protein [Chloroherpetonaceae bacterium]